MTKEIMKKYAEATVKIGVNVQPGQQVIIYADIESIEFVRYVSEAAYQAGAESVRVEWSDQELTKTDYQYRTEESLSFVPAWKEEQLKEMTEKVPCRIHILSADPDGLNGIDRHKMQVTQQNRYKVTKKYSDELENKEQWTIVAIPSKKWAKKVFPECSEEEAVEKLWNAILETVRISEDNDPVEAWNRHNENFKEKCKILNDYRFEKVVYKSGNGTDFTAWLIPQALWLGGGETALSGIYFNPNMPTEEIFTSPMKGKAEGTLVSTKPLSYQGKLIENFSITFKDGKAVEWKAEKGEDALEKMITADEGAAMLGELALVPCESPIDKLNILFYNTLFDENASCHVALGRGFSNTIEGFETMTKEETDALGINDSMIHVDFMIGAPDLSIKGYTRDGKEVEIFRNGKWVF